MPPKIIDWLKQSMSGYYNYTPPKTFFGEPKPHVTDEIPPDNWKKGLQGYYNLTPPRDLRGNTMPHYRREILEDRTKNLPDNFLNPEQRMKYYLSQDLENVGKRVGEVTKQPKYLSAIERGAITYDQNTMTPIQKLSPAKDKPHYLANEKNLLKLALGDIGVPKRLTGERGLIDIERQKLLLKGLQNYIGERKQYLPIPMARRFFQEITEGQNPRRVSETIPRQGSSGRMY